MSGLPVLVVSVIRLMRIMVSRVVSTVGSIVRAHTFHDGVDAGDFVDGHHPGHDVGGNLQNHEEPHGIHAAAPRQIVAAHRIAQKWERNCHVHEFEPLKGANDHHNERNEENNGSDGQDDLWRFEVLDLVPALAQPQVDNGDDIRDATTEDGDEHKNTTPNHHAHGIARRRKEIGESWNTLERANFGSERNVGGMSINWAFHILDRVPEWISTSTKIN